MKQPFDPLTPASAVASQNAAAQFHLRSPSLTAHPCFQPLLATRHIPCSASQAASPALPPKVSLKRDGDHITHICITCTCGQQIELACEYL